MHISNISIATHICENINIEGCILTAIYSEITLLSFGLSNANAKNKSLGIKLSQSNFSISDSLISNLSCEMSPCFLKAFKSQNITIVNIILREFSRLSILVEESSLIYRGNKAVDENDQYWVDSDGFLVCLNNGRTLIEYSEFAFIRGGNGGVLKFKNTKKPTSGSTILISENVLKNNIASNHGGAIYIENCDANITMNIFLSNSALVGGALSLNCSSEKSPCSWFIQGCIFENNEASMSGGGFFWTNSLPTENKNIFIRNKAIHGPDRASSPVKILRANNYLDEFVSGQTPSTVLSFFIADAYNQVCSTLVSVQAFLGFENGEVRPLLRQRILGNKLFNIKNGMFNIDKVVFISTPGQQAKLILWTNAIKKFSSYVFLFDNVSNFHFNRSDSYVFAFQVYFRQCIRGEIYKYSDNVCLKCDKNSYSFDPGVGKCLDCPPNAECTGDSILAKYNYWAESENSSVLYECNILKDACPGGNSKDPCNKGYWGVLCGNCEYNQLRKYFKNTFAYCIDCQDKNIILTICLLIFFSFCVVLQLILTLKECVQVPNKSRDITPSLLMNFLINYLVLVGSAKGLMSGINSVMKQIFEIINYIFDLDNTSDITTCFLGELVPQDKLSLFEAKQIFNTLVWILLFTSPYTFILILKLFKKTQTPSHSQIISLYISLFKLILQPLIKFYSKNFQCFSLGSRSYLKLNPSLDCFGKDHTKIIIRVIIPGMTLVLFGPLTCMFVYLIKKRHQIENPDVAARIWLLTFGYKTTYFYWEYVLLLKKIIIISMPIILGHSPQNCLLIMIFIVTCFTLIHVKLKPYKSSSLNFLGLLQNLSLSMTYGYTLISTSSQNFVFSYAFFLTSFISNFAFIIYWGHFFFNIYCNKADKKGIMYRMLTAMLHKLKNLLKKKPPLPRSRKSIKCQFEKNKNKQLKE